MALDVNEIVRVTAKGSLLGSIVVQNVFHLQNDSVTSYGNPAVMADMERYLEQVYTPIMGDLSDQLVWDEFSCDNVTANTKIGDGVITPNLVGGQTVDAIMSGVAVVLRGLTQVLKTQGRKFLPGMVETSWDGARIIGTLATNLVTTGANWVNPYTDASSLRTYMPGVYRKAPVRFTSFNEVVVNLIPGYQRRRKEGVGI